MKERRPSLTETVPRSLSTQLSRCPNLLEDPSVRAKVLHTIPRDGICAASTEPFWEQGILEGGLGWWALALREGCGGTGRQGPLTHGEDRGVAGWRAGEPRNIPESRGLPWVLTLSPAFRVSTSSQKTEQTRKGPKKGSDSD